VDFLAHDAAAMEQPVACATGKPGVEDQMLFLESETAAYYGEFTKSREMTRRAADSAQRASEKKPARNIWGMPPRVKRSWAICTRQNRTLKAAMVLADCRQGNAFSAIALALAGESAHAARLSDPLRKNFPAAHTIVLSDYLPMIRAATVLASGVAGRAVEALRRLSLTSWDKPTLRSPSLSILFTCAAQLT
jgi:hypothetical protein